MEPAPHLRAVDPVEPARGSHDGVTPPRRRGGSGRFLTDVIVELGFTDRERAQKAIEDARSAGIPPERVLLEARAITSEQLSHAIAERYGLDHLDLGVFKVDMAAVNLLSASAAKRYSAVPVSFVDDRTVLLGDVRPGERPRRRRRRAAHTDGRQARGRLRGGHRRADRADEPL